MILGSNGQPIRPPSRIKYNPIVYDKAFKKVAAEDTIPSKDVPGV